MRTTAKAAPRVGVFIGRFEPLHIGHLAVIREILGKNDALVLVLGSDCTARTVKNPWSSAERVAYLRACLTADEWDRTTVIPVKDYTSNLQWIIAVQAATQLLDVKGVAFEDCDVTLYGHDKDASTEYLAEFPRWGFTEVGSKGAIDATTIRAMYFEQDWVGLSPMVPGPVLEVMQRDSKTPEFERLQDEYMDIRAYKESWSHVPYPVIFHTVDAVVIKSGHLLVVRRKGRMGNGLLALPGGFLNAKERLLDGCIRELKEETKIRVTKQTLLQHLVGSQVFDDPNRSLRGRTITTAFCFDLGSGELPTVAGSDDADKAWWMSLRDVKRNEESFFEDHFQIIEHFTNRF